MSEKKDDKQNTEGDPHGRWGSTFGEKGDRKMAEKLKQMMNKGKIKDTE